MTKRTCLSFLLVIGVLFFIFACQADDDDDDSINDDAPPTDDDTTSADDDTVQQDDPIDPNAYWPPDAWGPYEVGVKTTLLIDPSRYEIWGQRYRALPLEVWYPAANDGEVNTVADFLGPLPPWAASLVGWAYGDYFETFIGITTRATRDATPVTGAPPFPVILFSHGHMAVRFQNYSLCEHLASHGFVVVAPDHYQNALFVNLPNDELLFHNPVSILSAVGDRPQDVALIYDYLPDLADELFGDDLELDVERFGVSGHSYGGLTSMLVGPLLPEVDAIAPINPVFLEMYPEDFTKPFFMLQSSFDTIVGVANHLTRGAFDLAASPQKVHLQLLHGGHYSATNACALLPRWLAPLMDCMNEERVDVELANDLTIAYITSFFRATLNDDERYVPYLKENHGPDELEVTVQWN